MAEPPIRPVATPPAGHEPPAGAGAAPLVLASASPQRTAILARLGVPHEVRVAEVREETRGDPEALVRENARRKARAVADLVPAGRIVLGADTVVLGADGRALGKPADEDEARAMLLEHAGREHLVRSAAVLCGGGPAAPETTEVEVADATRVRFRAYGPATAAWYLRTGEWRGRAGGYAVQERGGLLVSGIEGDWWAVVGLPVAALALAAPALFGLPATG